MLLYMRFPDVLNNQYLTHKLYLFAAIIVFYYVMQLIVQLKNKCTINAVALLKSSFQMALYCIVGYSIYVDLLYMDYTSSYFGDVEEVFPLKRMFIITIIIIMFVLFIEFGSIIFSPNLINDACIS